MSLVLPGTARPVPCDQCPLRPLPAFRSFSPAELAFVASFKAGEVAASSGTVVLSEGSHSEHLFTLLAGWAFRFKTLEDGRRQILNYLLPGDLVGLQGTILGEMEHSVEALTPLTLCVFQRERLEDLFRNHPGLAFDVTWLAAREERILDDHLLSLGQRSALERAAYLLAFLGERALSVGLGNGSVHVPLTQQHVADTLGLSIVHTNKTLRKLMDRGLIRWLGRSCEVIDVKGLRQVSGWHGAIDRLRPLI